MSLRDKFNKNTRSNGKSTSKPSWKKKDSYGDKSGKPAWKNNNSYGDKPMHKATCADCGDQCTVPFKPNGRKPVLCSNCFRITEGGKKKFNDRPQSKPKPQIGPSLKEEIQSINKKLEKILDHLNGQF